MDQIKIGKYIAEKRKQKGLTQIQLAEMLGMSDKSVSKWERGICLPNVSLYFELCGILEISINEFLSGEDLEREEQIKKSEDNLIQLSKDHDIQQKKLKNKIKVLGVAAATAFLLLGSLLFCSLREPRNYIESVNQDGIEMETATLFSDMGDTVLYRYNSQKSYEKMTIYMYKFQSGKLVSKEKISVFYTDFSTDGESLPSQGMLLFASDFSNKIIKLSIADGNAKYTTDISILDDANHPEYYGRTTDRISKMAPISYNSEQGLAVFSYGINDFTSVSLSELEQSAENGTERSGNDYVYYFSCIFQE